MDKKEFEVLEIGNMPVILAGVATTVLAIIGLANILPKALVSISAIAIGAALILVGIAVAVEKRHILSETIEGRVGPKMIDCRYCFCSSWYIIFTENGSCNFIGCRCYYSGISNAGYV